MHGKESARRTLFSYIARRTLFSYIPYFLCPARKRRSALERRVQGGQRTYSLIFSYVHSLLLYFLEKRVHVRKYKRRCARKRESEGECRRARERKSPLRALGDVAASFAD